uniref:chitinase n=1 Tax=Oryza barthii TaxID=65489 RepID=A0A0D3HSZ2_9ORYZ
MGIACVQLGLATRGLTAWGSPTIRDEPPGGLLRQDKLAIPRVKGAECYGRGAIPVIWNCNYGDAGNKIHEVLLHHPEYLQQNAMMVFKVAMWRCMTPMKKKQLTHDVSVGNWKPTKNHTLFKRLPGSGATMNMLYDDQIYGKGYIDDTNVFISNYQYNLDLMGVGRKHSGDNRDCTEQVAFNPSNKKPDDQQQQSYNITQFSNSREVHLSH